MKDFPLKNKKDIKFKPNPYDKKQKIFECALVGCELDTVPNSEFCTYHTVGQNLHKYEKRNKEPSEYNPTGFMCPHCGSVHFNKWASDPIGHCHNCDTTFQIPSYVWGSSISEMLKNDAARLDSRGYTLELIEKHDKLCEESQEMLRRKINKTLFKNS